MSETPTAEKDAGDWQAHDAPAAGVEWGVRFLPPHANAGVSVWMPDVLHAAHMVAETGMAEVVTRRVGPWTRVLPPASGREATP